MTELTDLTGMEIAGATPDQLPHGPATYDGGDGVTDVALQSLSCRCRELPGGWILAVLQGEADEASRRQIQRQLLDAVADRSPKLVVDLTAVNFMDSAGLTALLVVHQSAAARGGGVYLCGPSQPIRMMLELARVERIFPVHDTVADVLACAGCSRGTVPADSDVAGTDMSANSTMHVWPQ